MDTCATGVNRFVFVAPRSLQSLSSLQFAGFAWSFEENWPELKKNPTDAEGKVIETERKWSMPLPGVAKKLRSALLSQQRVSEMPCRNLLEFLEIFRNRLKVDCARPLASWVHQGERSMSFAFANTKFSFRFEFRFELQCRIFSVLYLLVSFCREDYAASCFDFATSCYPVYLLA